MISPSLSGSYHFIEREKKWQAFWEAKGLYRWDPTCTRDETFVVDTPPPTVSGHLHIGHACSYAQADFIVRFQRMLGKNIFYPMGFDDNGLPTERLVEKQKGVRAIHMDRADFIKLCQEVVGAEEEKFKALFKAMALSVDWSLTYQTISPHACKLSQLSFLALLAQGDIYRSEQPMLWDPIDGTALAQADVEDKEKEGHMHDMLFSHEPSGKPLQIATTRPELLPACVALFYHPDDARYQYLSGSYACTPLFHKRVPILADPLVQPEKGTGLVMCCTFGDQTDIIWWKQHQLPTAMILDQSGVLTAEETGPLKGLKVEAARKKVVAMLTEQGLLIQQSAIRHTIKCAERSGAPLEILMTPQWFIRTLDHKKALLERVNSLQWHPPAMKHRLTTWIGGLAWDWCISRQRYFGIPFPIWYSKRAGEEGKILTPTLAQLPVNPLHDLPIGYSRAEVVPDYDVMDTWATSSLTPQLSSHAINETFGIDYTRHQQLFPMDLRPQAHEIVRTWAFYTLLKAHLHADSRPWHNIMIHGWCLASDREKMSKSKGNVILPETLLMQYGADVIRYWAASARLGADTCYCENVMKNGKRLITKLWNAAKFISQHFDKVEADLLALPLAQTHGYITHSLDQWLLHSLDQLVTQTHAHLSAYGYAEALEGVERFFWSVFCDDYLEISKTRAYNTTQNNDAGQRSAIITLYHAFYTLLQLFAPILPHITEELTQALYTQKGSIHQQGNWPKTLLPTTISLEQMQQIDLLREMVALVRKVKADAKVSIKAAIQLLTIEGLTLDHMLLQELKAVTASIAVMHGSVDTIHPGIRLQGKTFFLWVQLA